MNHGQIFIQKTFRIIVSFTSFPNRIQTLSEVINSLLNQTFKANFIILYLAEEDFINKSLPEYLLQYQNHGLSIRFIKENMKQYLKLIPALKEFPQDVIVTADDDMFYEPIWLERLVLSYQEDPHFIYCHRAHLISMRKYGITNYFSWKREISQVSYSNPSFLYFATGVGGILYPPNIFFHSDLFNIEKAMNLCPSADDVWFWAMAVFNGIKYKICKGNFIVNGFDWKLNFSKITLFSVNAYTINVQISKVMKEYQLFEKLWKDFNEND